MRIGSVFSGIGCLELGLLWAGFGPVVFQIEQDEFCRRVLAKHWPDVPRFGDVRDVGPGDLPACDLLVGGFPCQDVAGCGSGAGLAGSRSGLWWEFARIIGDLRPAWTLVENVASGSSRWVDPVRRELGRLGYESLPIPLRASDVGAPHLRGRVFIIASNADSLRVRLQRQRMPGGRADGVRTQRDAVASLDGAARLAPDADGGRREGVGIAPVGGERRTRWSEPDGRRRSRADAEHGARPAFDWWTSGAPVCGVDAGAPTDVDRARLRALGNGAVPQLLQVCGAIISQLEERAREEHR